MKNIFFTLFLGFGFILFAKDDGGMEKSKGWKKYNLTLNLVSGQTIQIKSNFHIDYCNKVMFLYDENGNAVYPESTISVQRTLRDGTIITGYPTDSLWLFQSIKGKISAYSAKPEVKMKHVEYLSKDGEDMVEYDLETLRRMLSDNQEALSVFYKHKTQKKMAKNILAASFLVGLAHVYVESPIKKTVTHSDGTTYKEDVIFYPPLALGGVLWGLHRNRKSKLSLQESILIYNK